MLQRKLRRMETQYLGSLGSPACHFGIARQQRCHAGMCVGRGLGSGCESSSSAVCKSRIPTNYKKIIIGMKTRSAHKVGKV